jgi:hypothetical protein
VGRLASTFQRAVDAHREALAFLSAAKQAIGGLVAAQPAVDTAQLRDAAEHLRQVGESLAPGWLGADLTTADHPVFGVGEPSDGPVRVRLGVANNGSEAAFPALVPLLGGTHLAIDLDARDGRVAALLRTLVVRLLAAAPAGRMQVLSADTAALGATFLPVRALVDAGVMAEPATEGDATRALLDEAERHVRAAQSRSAPSVGPSVPRTSVDEGWLLVVAASLPDSRAEQSRLAALTHAGPAARVCVIVAGYPSRAFGVEPPTLGGTTQVRIDGREAWIGDPPGDPFSTTGNGLAAPVTLDGDPPAPVVDALAAHLGELTRREAALSFVDLVPAEHWTQSSIDGLRTTVGRTRRTPMVLAFDDATPHWLVGGRTGAGKTVFLLDVLYGLAARYSPDELALYLFDFKEGISFSEFVPTARDPSWIPHARAVGIESDREYGVAVLRELRREMNRRAADLKRYGVTKLSDLRRGQSDVAMPRIVTVIDEFQVLFAGNDALAREATALLEELARKARSYGIHLVLASQTVSGVEALYGKSESIFGQFPLRVALPGGSGILDVLNNAADGLPVGQAVVNQAAGLASANSVVAFPDAHSAGAEVAALRHSLWEARAPGSPPPAVFRGYDPAHVEDDPTFSGLTPGRRRPLALVGRTVDVGLSTAYFPLDATPGRHLAVVGTSTVGVDVLHAAAVSLARQHAPGTARFLVAPLVAAADEVAAETMRTLFAAGQTVTSVDAAALRDEIRKLADVTSAAPETSRTYLVVFGVDGASAVLGLRDEAFRSGFDDLRSVLRQGPAYGVHVLGWWRGMRRLTEDVGGSSSLEDVACLVALNVPGQELGLSIGQPDLAYRPRPNRALLIDRHDQRVALIVPFVRPGRVVEEV